MEINHLTCVFGFSVAGWRQTPLIITLGVCGSRGHWWPRPWRSQKQTSSWSLNTLKEVTLSDRGDRLLGLSWVRVNINNHKTVTCSYLRCHRWWTSLVCSDLHQHSRQCVPAVAECEEGAALHHQTQLHPASSGFYLLLYCHCWTLRSSLSL